MSYINNQQVIMLSLDTSSIDSGYAIWKNGILDKYGHIDLTNKKDIDKVSVMSKNLNQLIQSINPDIIVCEDVNVSKDIKTLKKLSEIVGSVRGAALFLPDCWFDKLPPNEWRKLIEGENGVIPLKRDDCKIWGLKKVQKIFGIKLNNDNISDAILIGQAYINLFGNDSDATEITL